jgi:hypothetical protein
MAHAITLTYTFETAQELANFINMRDAHAAHNPEAKKGIISAPAEITDVRPYTTDGVFVESVPEAVVEVVKKKEPKAKKEDRKEHVPAIIEKPAPKELPKTSLDSVTELLKKLAGQGKLAAAAAFLEAQSVSRLSELTPEQLIVAEEKFKEILAD